MVFLPQKAIQLKAQIAKQKKTLPGFTHNPNEAGSQTFLGQGWETDFSATHQPFPAVISEQAELFVTLTGEVPYLMSFYAVSPISNNHKLQTLCILLNGERVFHARLQSWWKKYFFVLPCKHVREGKNQISFQFTHASHPENSSQPAAVVDLMRIEPVAATKIFVNNEGRDAFFTLPRESCRIRLKIKGNAELSFGYARANGSSQKTQFCVNGKTKGKTFLLFSKTTRGKNHGWHDALIDLSPFKGSRMEIEFSTPLKDSEGIWSSPIMFSRDAGKRKDHEMNLVLISVDTLRSDHLGCYGYGRKISPAIDHLAQKGSVFLNAFAPSSWTLPSHIGMFTGLHPLRFLHRPGDAHISNPYYRFMDHGTTLAQTLKKKGYLCAAFTGGGLVSGSLGFSRGFSVYYNDDFSRFREMPEKENKTESIYGNAKEWLNKNSKRKFFLFFHSYEVHAPHLNKKLIQNRKAWSSLKSFQKKNPFRAVESWAGKGERQCAVDLYDSSIFCADKYVGFILEELEKLKILDRTLVILTSDHGEELWDRTCCWAHATLHEEIIGVPLIFLNFPDLKAGTRNKQFVSILDIVPTVLELLKLRHHAVFDGINLLTRAKDAKPDNRILLSQKCCSPFSPNFSASLRTSQYKYITEHVPHQNEPVEELYCLKDNLIESPGKLETNPSQLFGFKKMLAMLLNYYRPINNRQQESATYSEEENQAFLEKMQAIRYV